MRTAAFLMVLGCGAKSGAGLEVSTSWEMSRFIPNVERVTVTTSEPVPVAVEYGPDAGYGFRTPFDEAGLAHTIDVLGLPVGGGWHFRVIAPEAGYTGEDHEFPPIEGYYGLPEPSLMSDDGASWGTWTAAAFTRFDPAAAGVIVLDPDARVCWYWVMVSPVVVPWVAASADGRHLWLRVDKDNDRAHASVFSVALDGQEMIEHPTPQGHHAVALEPVPGVRFAWLQATEHTWEGETLVGDSIVETLEDGTTREVWSAFDHLEPRRHEGWEGPYYPEKGDWTHANGLSYDPEEDAYYVSLYYLDLVVKVDRSTGETIWQLGGSESDFTFVGDAAFSRQHAPTATSDGLLLFDNGTSGPSRAVRYVLDTDAWTAAVVWQWETPEGGRSTVLGGVEPLPEQQLISAWGDVGEIDIFGEDGTSHRRVKTNDGTVIARAQRLGSLYPP